MTLNEYQDEAIEASTHPLGGERTCIEYGALALCGEAGELANIIKKHWRVMEETGRPVTLQQRDEILLELGDVLWYTAFLATVLGADLSLVAKRNLEKLKARSKA